MTPIRLALLCAIGALIWAGIFAVLSHFGVLTIDWENVARYTVMIVIAVFTVGSIWIRVVRDEARLEYEERLEAQALDYDEYEEPLPPAA